jgi:flagellar biosynthetic protein FliP
MFAEHGGSRPTWAAILIQAAALSWPAAVFAQSAPIPPAQPSGAGVASPGEAAGGNPWQVPDLSKVAPPAKDSKGVVSTLQILVILTVLSLAPSILILTTCFTRIIVVLSMLRQAMGTQQLPPGQVITGLSLFLTFMVMAPTWHKIHQNALVPYLDQRLSQREAFDAAIGPMREFMIRQIELAENEEGVFMLMEYRRGSAMPDDETLRWQDVPTSILVPAYVLSELKAAFVMGFRFYLPFLVIDMVIATVLISMGMLMLPPILISLPFKVALFVLANGWQLVVGALLQSFG